MMEYCKVAPGRLFGIPNISMYNIPNAIKELERCKKNGMVGCMIWQVPPENLPFTSDYYNPFWEAASDLDMPVNVHILTGFNYSRFDRKGLDTYSMTVNQKLTDAANTLFDFVFGGPFARSLSSSSSTSKTKWAGFLSTVTNGTSILSGTALRRRCLT